MSKSLRKRAKVVLDAFLFNNILNNHNFSEDEWGITWLGENFVLRHYESEETFNFKVKISAGDLTDQEIKQAIEDQGWTDE